MDKFAVGQTVRVRPRDHLSESDQCLLKESWYLENEGKTFVVASKLWDQTYSLTGSLWVWSETWLEKAEEVCDFEITSEEFDVLIGD